VGDSRAIASVRGRVQSLSYDHKPNNELESKRIVAAGGWVKLELTRDHEFILLACDGIWDVLSNEEVLEFVRSRIALNIPPETVSFHVS